jgi:murein DD-endopeptidase MepM/ murein hydrolase activator NlpD
VSIDGAGGIVRSAGTEPGEKNASPEQTRDRLMRVAAEFESMLMLQMLKEMRKSGSWDSEDEHADGFGTQTMLETIDVELANHLSRVQGFGLGRQMLESMGLSPGAGDAAAAEGGLQPVREAAQTAAAKAAALRVAVAVGGFESGFQPERKTGIESGLPAVPGLDGIDMPEGMVTSGFGWRRDPLNGAEKFHRGIDIRAAYGQDIQAAGGGRVIAAGTEGAYGETVVIEHAGGVRTRYAHLSAALVTPGQEVAAGQVVGRAGKSGRATGTHLHFEVTTASGDRVDPAVFARFKAEGVVADLTGGPTLTQETRRHDDTN